MAAYYNEIDPFAAAWLRELIKANLIADGEVDERSIVDVQPDDLRGFTQCHFFAGIGGWSYALRLAGWPDARGCWTFSCPCQKLSSATRGRATAADLWPPQRCLLAASRPGAFFGEQVADRDWFDGLCADVEALGYEVGAALLPALGIGTDHIRERIYFAGHAHGDREPRRTVDAEAPRLSRDCRISGDVVSPDDVSRRVALMRGFGNAIVPELAAVFIQAYDEVTHAN